MIALLRDEFSVCFPENELTQRFTVPVNTVGLLVLGKYDRLLHSGHYRKRELMKDTVEGDCLVLVCARKIPVVCLFTIETPAQIHIHCICPISFETADAPTFLHAPNVIDGKMLITDIRDKVLCPCLLAGLAIWLAGNQSTTNQPEKLHSRLMKESELRTKLEEALSQSCTDGLKSWGLTGYDVKVTFPNQLLG